MINIKVPIVVTGFEPVDILQGIYHCVCQLEQDIAEVENQYSRVVNEKGNKQAQELINEHFTVATKNWRGIGVIPNSSLILNNKYRDFDAETKFSYLQRASYDNAGSSECISGLILQGIKKPTDCKAFGVKCCPERPLGAPMVSIEGVCSAYYNYRHELVEGK